MLGSSCNIFWNKFLHWPTVKTFNLIERVLQEQFMNLFQSSL